MIETRQHFAQHVLKQRFLRTVELSKHMRHRTGTAFLRIATWRTNANSKSGEILSAQMLDGALQTVMSSCTFGFQYAESPEKVLKGMLRIGVSGVP